ncbi:MAG: LytTR family DNA-binding domain-containing protein [Bacteroidales bacterium]|nr:LytTR family DNA-binding domain-containing protein [Bacteroidales bacterium]
MNCIIVDDDKLSRRILEEFILKTEGLELLFSFSNPIEAINTLKKSEDIDIIFLDIEMPEMNGLEFLNSLKIDTQVIIVSSKSSYAIDAFEFDVTDYILKPPTYSRFFKAFTKASARLQKDRIKEIGKEEIFIKKNSSLVRLKYSEILWVEALENYVVFNTFKEKFTIHFTMKAIEQKLPANKFTRVHRSFIVNTSSILLIEDNSVVIKIQDGNKTIPIGKSYKESLMNDINLIIK